MQLQRIYKESTIGMTIYLCIMGPLHARVSVKTSKLRLIYQIAFECVTVYIATAAIATYVAGYTYIYVLRNVCMNIQVMYTFYDQ